MRVFIDNKLQICDKSFKKTPQGYLMLEGIISRSGSQTYLDAELGVGNSGQIITIDRPISEVTDSMSIASFINMPVTDEHPAEGSIAPSNFAKHVKGTVLDAEPTKGNQVKASMIIHDAGLIQKIEDGKRELSAGYSAELEFSDDGKSAIQRKIRGNHVAFVDAARCGKECSIFDSKPKQEKSTMAKMKIKGTEYEVADAIVPAIQTVLDDNKALLDNVTHSKSELDKSLAMLDMAEEKVKKLEDEEETEEEKAKKIGDAAHELLGVLSDATTLIKDYDPKGKSVSEIKRDAVCDSMPDLKDKSDAYIDARFDMMVADAKNSDKMAEGFRDNMNDDSNIIDSAKAREKANERKRNLWKNKKEAS